MAEKTRQGRPAFIKTPWGEEMRHGAMACPYRSVISTALGRRDVGPTLTAPGSKVWTYTYPPAADLRHMGRRCAVAHNRLSQVAIPNGMHTEYTYDTSGRQDSIHHKDGSTVVQGFDYAFDDGGQITSITHEDGAYWAYEYDGRERLTKAERYDDTPSLLHRFTYTYDHGDNLLTKAVYDPSGPSTDTTAFAYNNANEQTSRVNGGTTITQAYDAWGRLTSKSDGTYAATYAYRYGSKLYSVTSDFPGEGNVTYETGGNGKRRSRVAGVDETWYNYTVGFDEVSTEDDADGSTGTLTMTNVVRSPSAPVSATLADLAGATPASGTARYYATDHLGSTRSAWDASKASVGTYEFTPYGSEYMHTGAALDSLASAYTGKPWDDTAQLFHFPYRQYSPDMARWTTRDPLGMVDGPNVYGYVMGNPVLLVDPLGDRTRLPGDYSGPGQFVDAAIDLLLCALSAALCALALSACSANIPGGCERAGVSCDNMTRACGECNDGAELWPEEDWDDILIYMGP